MKTNESKALNKLTKFGAQVRLVRKQVKDLVAAKALPKEVLSLRGINKLIRAEARRRAALAIGVTSVNQFNKLVNKGVKRSGRVKFTADSVLALSAR